MATENVVQEIFAKTVMITAARVTLLVAGLLILIVCFYTGTSIVVRMLRGQWLQRAGGFEAEVSEYAHRINAIERFVDDPDAQETVEAIHELRDTARIPPGDPAPERREPTPDRGRGG
jgi:hypothetical protein